MGPLENSNGGGGRTSRVKTDPHPIGVKEKRNHDTLEEQKSKQRRVRIIADDMTLGKTGVPEGVGGRENLEV